MLKSCALLTVFTAFSLAQQAECVAAGFSYTFTHDEYYAYRVLINLLGVIGDTTTGLLLFAGIAAAVILVLNVIAAIVVFLTHKKRNPRPPTEGETSRDRKMKRIAKMMKMDQKVLSRVQPRTRRVPKEASQSLIKEASHSPANQLTQRTKA
ncbi:hypothetical protein M3Y97_01124800 [Aphelenchoides bicaudatus]|nr:hypothetical protein M3Y97_01124800 [Aphelenchoides bicaudatus]